MTKKLSPMRRRMKIYKFKVGITTYFSLSRSLKQAIAVGEDSYREYLGICERRNEEPVLGRAFFVPTDVTLATQSQFLRAVEEELSQADVEKL